METGIALVDKQHKELVDKLNAVASMGVNAVSGEVTQETLDFLGDYAAKHLSDEEDLQKQSNFPKHEWHKGQHQLFIKNFQGLKAEFAANGHSPKFTLDLNRSIIDWIMTHIRTADIEFGKHYTQKR
jgi:hemerythrin